MLKPEILGQIKSILGEDKVNISEGKVFLYPQDTSSIAEIVKLANQKNFKIIPLGKETKIKYQSQEDEVVIKTDRLNKIKKVVPEDLYIILEPGVSLKELNQEISSYSLFYPLSTENSLGTTGGSVATSLQGENNLKEIKTKEYVLALEIVSPTGEILKVGARTFKSVTGYDLPRLYVGSWGSLGMITEITLRLMPVGKKDEFENIVLKTSKKINPSSDDPKDKVNLRIKEILDPQGIFPHL